MKIIVVQAPGVNVMKQYLVQNRPRQVFKVNIVPGNTKGGSITVLLTSCLTGLD
jgi:hypothetical protein